MKKKLKFIIPSLLVIFILVLCWGSISNFTYLVQDNITSDVKKETNNYTKVKNEKDYLVYFYNKKECETCTDYIEELKKYESNKSSFPVYKVNTAKLSSETVEEALFMDDSIPYVVHVKEGEVFYNYIGGFTADKLPNKKQEYKPL